jgi:hypothetical protein
VTVELPEGTTLYVINLIDENQFLVSYPDMPGGDHFNTTKEKFSRHAFAIRTAE